MTAWRPTPGRRFDDRHDAGRRLAGALTHLRAERPLILGLPRGGVVVAYEVALALDAPLDIVITRKLGAPFRPEFAIGAIGEDDVMLVDDAALDAFHLRGQPLDLLVARERAELERRTRRYRGARAPLAVAGRTVILVDDGVATGSTARAAAAVLRKRGARRIVLAVPVGPPDVRRRFAAAVDEVICLDTPRDFSAVGQAYVDFAPTGDDEVEQLLRAALERPVMQASAAADPVRRELHIPAGTAHLRGDLSVPAGARGLVIFAHGSGSGRHSPRNRQVAAALCGARLATLLFDLLTEAEARDRSNVFDVRLLAGRLAAATTFVTAEPDVAGLPVGYFGASTGAAAALTAAAELDGAVTAVVSRGGRPDLAARLEEVTAPTLLIVGGADTAVLELNRAAGARMRCEHRVAIVPGATHLFEEPGTLEQVEDLALEWFEEHLR